MGGINEFTEVVNNLIKETEALRVVAAKTTVVPFMYEKVSRREALNRVGRMTPQELTGMAPEERAMLLKEVGTPAVMNILRRQR